MTRDYKSEPEQTEPKELVSRRTGSQLSRPLSPNESDQMQNSPSSVQNLRVCKSPTERDRERNREREKDKEGKRPSSVENVSPPISSDCGVSDIIHTSNNMTTTCSLVNPPIICSRLPSPLNCDALPGPSNMPPVQQVPLVYF